MQAIICQLPTKESAAAFWKMVAQHDVEGVLLFLTAEEMLQHGAYYTFPKNRFEIDSNLNKEKFLAYDVPKHALELSKITCWNVF